jgi:DNA-binding response OmpR family regulator
VRLRQEYGWRLPILFVTSREREEDVVEALSRGADDYMTKPVKRAETLARIAALARRAAPQGEETGVFEFPPFSFDTTTLTVRRQGEPVELTDREFALALYLFRNAGCLLSRGQLLEAVWGRRADLPTRTVDTHVSRVRRKLALDPSTGWRVRSVYQHGYRLEALAQEPVPC